MQEKQVQLVQQVNQLQDEISRIRNQQRQEPEVGENSAAKSVNKISQPKCVLIDWSGTDENVAEGRIVSSDPEDKVNDTRLGPTDVKVLVHTATKPDAFLWRPATNMFIVEEAVGEMIAWPAAKCVILDHELQPEDILPTASRTNSLNKCKLLDLSSDDVVVAEGRWQTQEEKALVNGLPLGPKAVKVFVDVVLEPETFIWRPTKDMTYFEDCVMHFVAWPANKVVFEKLIDATCHKSPLQNSHATDQTSGGKSASSGPNSAATGCKSPVNSPKSPVMKTQLASQSPLRRSPRKKGAQVIKQYQKIKLMDISGRKRVVAEGRWHSNDPDQKIHFVRLGPNAARVWVYIVHVDDAAVWRPSDEIEYMRDALGSSIAWPED